MIRRCSHLVAATVLAVGTLAPAVVTGAAQAATHPDAAAQSKVDYHQQTSTKDFLQGRHEGTFVLPGALTIGRPVGTMTYTDPYGSKSTSKWNYARYTTPVHHLTFGAKELVASWNAYAPHNTWLQVEMQATMSDGATSGWYVMGRWAASDTDIHRTTVPNQSDANGTESIDTYFSPDSKRLDAYRLRVTLYRKAGTHARPLLRSVGAMASAVPERKTVAASPLGGAEGIELKVPRYSQDIHSGQYPQYDGGGEAWCSPTSTSMVVSYWGRGPTKHQMSWIDPSYADPQVDYAARNTYDYNYEGTGNWPFNTAYAARFGLNGFITRLRSLTELEQFIKAGIPVVTSQSFKASELPGAGYSTDGHLMVIIGFTSDGDVIANDPASPNDAAVRHVYPRANFENVWQRSSSTGGIVYIMYPPGHRLPPHIPGVDHNW